jgi:hypothetical protein
MADAKAGARASVTGLSACGAAFFALVVFFGI